MGTPRTLSLLVVLAAALCLGRAPAALGSAPAVETDYFSVQVATGPRESLLAQWRELKGLPFARIERRNRLHVLLVGFWTAREDAKKALVPIRARHPNAFVRTATYEPQSVVQRWESPMAEVPPPAAARRGSEGAGGISIHDKPSANVRYLVEREPAAAVEVAREESAFRSVSKPAAAPVEMPGPTVGAQERLAATPAPRPATRPALTAPVHKPTPSVVQEPESPEETLRRQIAEAVAQRDDAALAGLASDHPQAFGCDRVDWAWAAAEALATRRDSARVLALARRLIDDCPGENDRLATLYKVKPRLGERDWRALLELEAARPHSAEGEARYRKLAYEHRLARWLEARQQKAPEAAQLLDELALAIEVNRDGGAALLAGWQQHEAGRLDAAAAWFQRALAWGASAPVAHHGLALAALGSGHLNEALEHARALPPSDAVRAPLLGDILVAQALAEFRASRYARTLALLDEASGHRPLPRHARTALAWSLIETDDAKKAASAFAELYREQPDEETASGVLASHRGADRVRAIEALAHAEPLRTRWRQERGREAFVQKRFLAAAALDPERYAALGTPAFGALDALVGTRTRTGSEGLARLRLTQEPTAGLALAVGDRQELGFRVDAVRLSSGELPANNCVGSACSGAYAFAPVTRASGLQPRLTWRDERDQVWEAEIGLTPDGGAVSPRPFGRLARQLALGWGTATGSFYAAPVKDSILSYVGLRDPYGGGTWGRVLRYGAEIGVLRVAEAPWSVGASLRAEHLAGTRVTGNDRLAFAGSVGRDLRLAGFDYAVLGAGVTVDGYRRNLSGFSLGEGGYFSPQHYARVGPALDFLTEEGRQWIARGRLSTGWATKREGAIRSHGTETSAEVALARNLTPLLQVSVFWNRSLAPQFSETIFGVGLRVYFDARRGALSADLPRASELR